MRFLNFVWRAITGVFYMLLHAVMFFIMMLCAVVGLFSKWNGRWWFKESFFAIWEDLARLILALTAIFWFPWQDRLDYPFFSADEPTPDLLYIILGDGWQRFGARRVQFMTRWRLACMLSL